MDLKLNPEERLYLRSLAEKQREYAALPVMKEREAAWYAHNACKGEKPIIVVEWTSFWPDMYTPKCSTPFGRMIERRLMEAIIPQEKIGDDLVVPDWFEYGMNIGERDFGIDIPAEHAADNMGRTVGYQWEHPITNIRDGFAKLRPFRYTYDKEEEEEKIGAVNELLGDILPVRVSNEKHMWYYMLTAKAVRLLGLEQLMMSMYDEPDEVHRLMRYITDNCLNFIDWQEKNGLLTMNNGNHFAGAGSRGFTHELKSPADGRVRASDIWGNLNSQESSSISPEMYREFVYPYEAELAARFGMVYYGCCEPVHPVWDLCLKDLPHLRKVSVSAWCDEEIMGDRLRGGKIVYSRKPSPHFLGVDPVFDEEGFKKYINTTLKLAKGCEVEFIFRDVYTTVGDPDRPRRAVRIMRRLIEENWGK